MLIEWILSVPSAVESEMKALLLQLACRFSTAPVDEGYMYQASHYRHITGVSTYRSTRKVTMVVQWYNVTIGELVGCKSLKGKFNCFIW